MPRRKTKPPNLHGVSPKTYPKSVRAYVDYDYTAALSPKELQWLSDFSDNHYAADYRRDPNRTPKAKRRKSYRAKNAANRDLYAYADVGNNEVPPDAVDHDRDWTPPPKALASPEYKAALAQLREAIDSKDEHQIKRAERLVWHAALSE